MRRFFATESAGGVALVAAAVIALVWANTASASYASFAHDLHDPVNDGLMSLFFFVVGIEIRREWRAGALPAIAAVGGMVVPAAIYAVVVGDRGWGIPMATDIAFAVGVLTLLGSRVAPSLRVFLLTLAIVDDLGAIAVIALFYGGGVHPAIVGVALAVALPLRWSERVEDPLHRLSTFVVVPIFALVNAGIDLGEVTASAITTGVVLGLVVGKPLGITLFAWLAVRTRVASLPAGASLPAIAGIGAVAGIGFTVSLFVTDLAFDRPAAIGAAKLGVLLASVLAAAAGTVLLAISARKPSGHAA